MPDIIKVLAVPVTGASYAVDLAALHEESIPLAQQYTAQPVTSGFRAIREIAEAVSVGLQLEDAAGRDSVVWGDSVAVAYTGHAGRDPVFRAAEGLSTVRRHVAPLLEGREITTFREMAAEIEALTRQVRVPAPEEDQPQAQADVEAQDQDAQGLSRRDLLTAPFRFLRSTGEHGHLLSRESARPRYVTVERPLHTAVRYGVSQALLKAVASVRQRTPAEVIADEWGLPQPVRPVPIHTQGGADSRQNVDKMIVRRVASLPHMLVEDVPGQLGEAGASLIHDVRWLRDRIKELGGSDYRPAVHVDLQGALGHLYGDNLGKALGYLYRLESSVQPYVLRVESPVVKETRAAQIETLRTLRDYIRFRSMTVEIVADEWANTLDDVRAFLEAGAADMIHLKMPDLGGVQNTVEAVLACQEQDVGVLLGGSSAETDLSARLAAHVALATRPDLILARPGMGVDEAISIVLNEMTRTLALIQTRPS